ncbi:MAG: hypothetical protein GX856_07135, partial [Gammaproteobacteria bacterium]|nr:hypothetical protein [Gammaproteobacteria bacterium]
MTTPESQSPDAQQRSQHVRLRNLRELARQALASQQAGTVDAPAGGRRWSRRQWAHASLVATAGALLLAIVPGFNTAVDVPDSTRLTTLSLSLPAGPVAAEPAAMQPDWTLVTVEKGQTLGAIFDELGIPAATMHRLLAQPGARDALTRLR